MREKFPQTNKHFNTPKNEIKSSLAYFHIITGTLPMSLSFILIFEGSVRELSTWKYPQGFHGERRRKYPHGKLPFNSPNFRKGNHEEISAGMIPWLSRRVHSNLC